MIEDPFFYLCAIPAVLMFGMGKGGLGGGLPMLAVPLMSLAIPPLQAAAILLPLLLIMDAVAIYSFRGQWALKQIKIVVPGALAGVLLGALTFRYMSENAIKILIAIVALGFSLNYYFKQLTARLRQQGPISPLPTNRAKGTICGALAGFTSFGIHAGGPPISLYILPLQLEKKTLVATFALFFGIVNAAKVAPYFWLGQFDNTNLLLSLILAPLAPVGVRIGYHLLHRISERTVYEISYLFLILIGIKLGWEGATGV